MATLKKAAGLVTFPNEVNKREGALEVAENVVIDADDIIESRRGFNDYGDAFPVSDDRAKQLLVYKDRIIRHYDNTLQYDSNGSGIFQDFNGSYEELVTGLRIKSQEANSNLYFTENSGIKKISARSAADFTTASGFIKEAGGVKATDLEAELAFTTGGFLPPQSKVAYRVVWGIRDLNNNLILGAPSSRVILTNTSADVNQNEEFQLEFTSGTVSDYTGKANDRYIQISSSNTDYFIWFSDASNNEPPEDAGTIGRTPIEVDIDGLSSAADIAVATANQVADLPEFSADISGAIVTITSTEDGENLQDAAVSANLTVVNLTILNQGSVTEGQTSNANITIQIPDEVDSVNFFYQLYRTAPATAGTGQDLVDVDPGDEMNLAFEANVTQSELTAGEVTFEDITTESFRASGAFLYTNPNTGQGILQANEKPPVAKDIELFRNTTFYANTRTAHKLQINFLSTTDFTSGVSNFIIGNEDNVAEYTFVGEEEATEITTDSYANTDDTGYIFLNSARDERKYYIWFDKGSTTDPAITSRVGVRVEIESGDTDVQVANKLASVLNALADFSASSASAVVTVTNVKNGNTTDASIPVALTNNWAVSVTTQGDGEDLASNEVLLSNQASAAQSIEESSLSLVRAINADASSPIRAFYLSGPDDLPGIIQLEARNFEDKPFYLATSDPNIQAKFNPELSLVESITAISIDTEAEVTSAGHGLVTGDEVFIYNTDSTPAIQGSYTITVIDANTFSVPVETFGAGTTGNWFLVNSESDNEVKPNRVYYSKTGQPEAVPIVNFLDIGPQDSEILRIIALRDNLMVLKEDGIYLITGSTAPNFGARLIDGSTNIIAADTAAVLNNRIYCLSSDGVVTITEGGVSIISRPIEDRILNVTRSSFNFEFNSFGLAYESDRSYLLWLPTLEEDTVATQAYRYNTFTRTWTRWTTGATCGVVNEEVDKLYIGPSDRNYIYQERKNGDRTDYADRNFTIQIPANSITNGTVITPSSLNNIETGDVLLQTQRVTIAQYNRLLLKLDIDPGLDDTDYFSTLEAVAGDQMDQKLNSLNTKLVADDASGVITSVVFSSNFETQQTEFNSMIGELNNISSDASFDNYSESTGTVVYEGIITQVSNKNSNITINSSFPFLVGDAEIYKRINKAINWAPQHFGASDQLKQVREGTVLFDQTNFYSGTVGYSSDRSKNFERIPFLSDGPGYWSGSAWGDFTWGGEGREIPVRTLIPRDKQRCRHIRVLFEHVNAREKIRVLGISLEPRAISTRAYR